MVALLQRIGRKAVIFSLVCGSVHCTPECVCGSVHCTPECKATNHIFNDFSLTLLRSKISSRMVLLVIVFVTSHSTKATTQVTGSKND